MNINFLDLLKKSVSNILVIYVIASITFSNVFSQDNFRIPSAIGFLGKGISSQANYTGPFAFSGIKCISVINGVSVYKKTGNSEFKSSCFDYYSDSLYASYNISFLVYPNPVVSTTTLKFKSGNIIDNIMYDISILNLSGQVIKSFLRKTGKDLKNGVLLDMSSETSGIYFVSIISKQSNFTLKILHQ